ncbi:TraY domain-containing protein [Klebsiella pneumoniae]|uniref:TraY domain-containing protein n=1 Tax=Klebsiella pneumoniae TaxID=573 RepID=UPI0025B49B7F|nr:TraY domain-containing protein [Klebsiella pneumoniae]MDN3917304.1 TraY domain-containing protein [Klebsiella pneumoniae]
MRDLILQLSKSSIYSTKPEDTNKKLIAAKNKSNRSKSHEVYLRLKAHLFEFPDFYSSEVEVIRRSVSET